MSKCKGCGVRLQFEDKNKIGYSPKADAMYCQRCFKLTNYHENIKNSSVIKDEDILAKINKKGVFTFFLTDILNLNQKVIDLYNKINNKKILVLTKIDIFPHNLKYNILVSNIKKVYKINEVILFSKENGFGKNEILNICSEYGEVIFTGPTSSGKSSLINYLFSKDLTVSEYQNTTTDFITINHNDLKILDAPGFNQMYSVNEKILKKTMNPKTITLEKGYTLMIDDYSITSPSKITLSLYFPETVKIKTKKTIASDNNKIKIKDRMDLVLYSLGFIYFKNASEVLTNIKGWEIRESVVSYHE